MNTFVILFSGLLLATVVTPREIYLRDDAIMFEEESVEVSSVDENMESLQKTESEHYVSEVKVGIVRVKREVETLYVKTFVLVDYALYKRWLNLLNEDINQTISAIRYYYAHLLNAVANKYATIDTGSYRYTLQVVGYFIAQTVEASSFTESENVKVPNSNAIKYGTVLQNLAKWVDNNTGILPNFGVLAGFTTYGDPSASGMAFVKAACTRLGVSISQSGMMSSTANIVAHEIGHVLGSGHDGEDNTCSKDDLYLMTAVLSFGKVTNYHTFSSCSRSNFENYISSLKSSVKDKCFKKESSPEDENVKKYLDELPGLKFTPDQECQNLMGPKSYYCSPGAKASKEICQNVLCFHPANNYCVNFPDSRALDGTPCGNKSWCMNKQCVYDERAPEGDDYCTYGDSKDPIVFNGIKTYCTDVQKNPHLCYYDFFEDHCCGTCLGHKDPENPQCMYGDRNQNMRYGNRRVTCEDFKTDNAFCYTESFRKICCKTCAEIAKGNPPECLYGDLGISLRYGSQVLHCPDFKQHPYFCNQFKQCCKTCAEIAKESK